MVRLFIYFAEADLKEDIERKILLKQFKVMQWRLWYIIAWPAMILTMFFGIGMICIKPVFLEMPYMQLKLGFVFLLILYHLQSHFIFLQQKNNMVKYSSNMLRIWNEVATLFLVSIVFIIVLKNELTWIYGTIGFLLFGIILMLGIRLYKKVRFKG